MDQDKNIKATRKPFLRVMLHRYGFVVLLWPEMVVMADRWRLIVYRLVNNKPFGCRYPPVAHLYGHAEDIPTAGAE